MVNCSPRFAASRAIAIAGVAFLWSSTSGADGNRPAPAVPVASAGVHAQMWPRVAKSALDPSIETRVAALISKLTLEEKVGQLIQADIASVTPEDVRRYRLGSILNGGNSGPNGDDLAPAAAWLAAADAYYLASMDASDGKHAIPVLWGTDAVHGHSNIIGATIFPHNIGLGAARNSDLIRRIGAITAREIRTTGQDWTFAPTLAVVKDVRWGRSYESYSQRPDIVRKYASAMIEGLQGKAGSAQFLRGEHVLAAAKHFVGDGATLQGRDQGDAQVSEKELRDVHAAGYPPAISAGVQSIMTSFSSWQGEKLTGHKGLLTDVLKGRMRFDGIVLGDWNAHGQVHGCDTTSCARAFNAGMDVLMAPDSWKALYDNTLRQARAGEIPLARIDDAVRRVLRVKLRAGLFEQGKPSTRAGAGRFERLGAAEHRAVARQAVRESLVLLKNQGHLLPLHPKLNVLVAGDGADNIGKQCGGWTLTWQGTGVTNAHFPNGQSIFAGIRAAVTAAGGKVTLSPGGEYSTRPDVAIAVFGEDPYAEFQGDIDTLEYQPGDKRDLALLRKLRAADIPVVSVFLSGRPLWVNPEINASNAFVAAWLPGSEGGGIADVLFRKADGSIHHDFKGTLSFSWPRDPLQITGEPAQLPLFPYGFGLTYGADGDLGPLSEAVPTRSSTTDTRTFFAGGRAGSGWHTFIAEESANRVELTPGGVGASPNRTIQVTATERAAQEDARLVAWSGERSATWGIERKAPIDLQRESNGQLSLAFHYRVDAPPSAAVEVAMECGPSCRGAVPITHVLRAAPSHEWRRLKIPLRCFAQVDMRNVIAPFTISTRGNAKLGVADVRLETGLDGLMSCPP